MHWFTRHFRFRLHFLKRLVATGAAVALLIAQFAVSAYACPTLSTPQHGKTIEAAMTIDATLDVMPCHSPASSPGLLCKAHCEQGQKNVSGDKTPPNMAFVPAFIATLTDFTSDKSQTGQATFRQSLNLAAAPPPPVHLLYCVFRI